MAGNDCNHTAKEPASNRALALQLLFPLRPVEGTEGEIAEDGCNGGVQQESLVIWPPLPLMPQLPRILRKIHSEETEKKPCNLQPEHAARMGKRTPNRLAESFSFPLDRPRALDVDRGLFLHRMSALRGSLA